MLFFGQIWLDHILSAIRSHIAQIECNFLNNRKLTVTKERNALAAPNQISFLVVKGKEQSVKQGI